MKNLANCKPSEFARQTAAIKRYVDHYFKVTRIPDIRKKLPVIPEGATSEERKKLIEEQAYQNFGEIIEEALEKHPEETVGLLALVCFIPLEEADDHPMDEYFSAIADILDSEGVMRFFVSLSRAGKKRGS